MKLGTNLRPLTIEYPEKKKLPKDLIELEEKNSFKATHKMKPFLEQYSNEKYPHKINHLHFQFGSIRGKWATKLFHKKKPVRIVYSNAVDPLLDEMKESMPSKVNFPPGTSSTPIARSLREMALKWIVEQFFSKKEYMAFDEPILNAVNPDLLVVPNAEANKIIKHCKTPSKHEIEKNIQEGYQAHVKDIELDGHLFVEIKAFHKITHVGEKEVLQAFNYAVLGDIALLITTGTIDDLSTINILNEGAELHALEPEGYDHNIFNKFIQEVKTKYKEKINNIDLRKGQDQYDTRGIYISTKGKIEKMYKYTKKWPNKIEYIILKTPEMILKFIDNGKGLGIAKPDAFCELLEQMGLLKAAELFKNIRSKYIEEIILNPTLLYPK